tara:strand:+ start:473 stop:751 length:279 start_codon:yes stop_codon:yes gene_type:complete
MVDINDAWDDDEDMLAHGAVLTKRTSTVTHTAKLTGAQILQMLGVAKALRSSATVQFAVPSGGNYSGMTLDVDKNNCVTVTWRTTEQGDQDE